MSHASSSSGATSSAATLSAGSCASGCAVIIGLGEMGGIFAHALLKEGLSIRPVNRGDDIASALTEEVSLVVVAVGEGDLHSVLEQIPRSHSDRLVLLQNELLPPDWEQFGLAPTVAVVWFEKKRGKAVTVIRKTPIFGPQAEVIARALNRLDLSAEVIPDADRLTALMVKNLYILTANLAGLSVGGTVGALWAEHRTLAVNVARDVLKLQMALAGTAAGTVDGTVAGTEPAGVVDADRVLTGMAEAFLADPDHGCRGRSAAARLKRALLRADALGLRLPALSALPVD